MQQFPRALGRAETVLDAPVSPALRAAALLVAADAAHSVGSYAQAAARYRQFLLAHQLAPEAARVALSIGWAEFRQGHSERALRAWADVARVFPTDPRAPLGLALAAQVAMESSDPRTARALIDRILMHYASTPYAALARLNRSLLALREDGFEEGLRELREVIQSGGISLADDRARLLEALNVAGAETALQARSLRSPRLDGVSGDDRDTERDAPSASILRPEAPVERLAETLVEGPHARGATPLLLHALVLLAAEDEGWSAALVGRLATRLVDAFPSYPPAPELLARVAASAASAGQWPIARQASAALVARYPDGGPSATASLDLAEALFRTGAPAEASVQLQRFVLARPEEPQRPRALRLLADVEKTLGDRRAALATYDLLRRDHPAADRTGESLLAHARLLVEFGRSDEARPLLEKVVRQAEGEALGGGAYRLAELSSAEGQHAAAAEWYMTAVYTADGSTWRRRALLGAGRSLTALDLPEEALIVYRMLAPPHSGAPDELGRDAGAATRAGEPEEREASSEAAYRIAELLRAADRYEDALDMYLTAAYLSPGSARERRALLGALHSLVAAGDRQSAEALYRRLLESSASEPAILAEARRALAPEGAAEPDGEGRTAEDASR
jgi:TolA-binding protein